MKAGGIVLCGGYSSRMGQPKAWLPFGAETLLQRVVGIVHQVVGPVIVVAADGQELPILPPEVRFVRDNHSGRGPLEGLMAGLLAFEGQVEVVYLSSCDVPLLQPMFIQRMIELLGTFSTAVPRVDGRTHPLAAVYRLTVRPTVESLLRSNQLRMTNLFDSLPTRFIEASELVDVDPQLLSLRNVNTPEEYAAVLRELDR